MTVTLTAPTIIVPAVVPATVPDPLRQVLGQAPIGAHGMAEAALAWRQLRPARGVSGITGRRLPIAFTPHAEVAARLARLLTGVTWAVVAGDLTPHGDLLRVEVPREAYHRVARTFTAVWRQTAAEFTAVPAARVGGTAGAQPDPSLAAALWRMALLIDGVPTRAEGRHRLGTAMPSTADVLARAAQTLGVAAVADRTCGAVTIPNSADLRRLLASAGATARR